MGVARTARLGFVTAIALGLTPRAAAGADVEPVRIDVHAPPGCADRASFFAEVRARTSRARLAAPGEEARTFDVRLVPRADGVDGELLITDPPAPTTHREVSGRTCEGVSSVLALVTALAIDPLASTAPLPASVGREAANPPPNPPPTTSTSTPTATPASTPTSSSSSTPTSLAARSITKADPAAPAQSRWHVSAGVHLAVLGNAAPDAVLGGGVFADAGLDAPRLFAPSFRLSAYRTRSSSIQTTAGSAALTWTFGRAEACPVRLAFAVDLVARPCLLVEAGELAAVGSGPPNAQSRTRPWATLGVLARLEWTLAGALRFEAEGGLVLPLVRETYFFIPDTSVYTAPPLAGMAGFGLGARFP